MKSEGIFIGIGGNEGSRWEYLNSAKKLIEQNGCKIIAVSPVYETPAWGFESELRFLNQVIQVQTLMEPVELLKTIQHIEEQLGRVRTEKQYSSRTIDLDILFYNQMVMDLPQIQLPHPRMHLRKFVLEPIAVLAPGFVHPVFNRTMVELNRLCPDTSICRIVEEFRQPD